MASKPGRLVRNHSTHAPGVVAILKSLCKISGIHTVTPGRVHRTKHYSQFRIRITMPILGGHKLLARSGGMVQEVFVTTHLDAKKLQGHLDEMSG